MIYEVSGLGPQAIHLIFIFWWDKFHLFLISVSLVTVALLVEGLIPVSVRRPAGRRLGVATAVYCACCQPGRHRNHKYRLSGCPTVFPHIIISESVNKSRLGARRMAANEAAPASPVITVARAGFMQTRALLSSHPPLLRSYSLKKAVQCQVNMRFILSKGCVAAAARWSDSCSCSGAAARAGPPGPRPAGG